MRETENRPPVIAILLLALVAIYTSHRAALAAPGDGAETGGVAFSDVQSGVKTPHIAWANPLHGGDVRALVVAPWMAQRETVELAQRLGLEYAAIATANSRHLAADDPPLPGTKKPIRARMGWLARSDDMLADSAKTRIRNAMAGRPDVVIVGNFAWPGLPSDFRQEVLRRVEKEGMGLVLVYNVEADKELVAALRSDRTDGDPWLVEGVPVDLLPILASPPGSAPVSAADRVTGGAHRFGRVTTFHQFGKGRILFLNYGPLRHRQHVCLTPRTQRDELVQPILYEFYHSLLAKGVLWASGRKPGLTVAAPPAKRLWQSDLVNSVAFEFEIRGDVAEATFRLAVHDADAQEVWRGDTPVRSPIEVRLPVIPAGRYFVTGWLLRADKVVDWATTVFDVHTARVSVRSGPCETGKALPVRFEFPPLQKDQQARLDWVDSAGRVLRRWTANDVGLDALQTRIEVKTSCTHLMGLVGEVRDDHGTMLRQRHDVIVPDRRWEDDFHSLVWGDVSQDRLLTWVAREGARLAFDSILVPVRIIHERHVMHDYARKFSRLGLRLVPYIWSYFPCHHSADKRVRQRCLTDPTYMDETMVPEVTRKARWLAPYAPLGYTLGDENAIGWAGNQEMCFSPTCKQDLGRYVRRTYGEIEALNTAWGTSYEKWEEAEPVVRSDVKTAGDEARWGDHRLHMDEVFARGHERGRKAVLSSDPGAKVGADGMLHPFWGHGGTDAWRLSKALDLYVVYSRPFHREALRSFARPGQLRSRWTGYSAPGNSRAAVRFMPWDNLFNGMNGSWFYLLFGVEGAFQADLRPQPQFWWYVDEMREIRSGIGRLLMHSRRLQDGIAILYSQASIHSATKLTLNPFEYVQGRGYLYPQNTHPKATTGFIFAVEGLGLQFDVISYEQLAAGELVKRGYRVLLLGHTESLSDAEADAVRAFVHQGGTVIADMNPGVRDGHCKRRPESPLADVFGVTARVAPKIGDQAHTGDPEVLAFDGRFGNGRVDGVKGGPPIEVAGATALGRIGEAPAVLMNQAGDGRAVYLNVQMGQMGEHKLPRHTAVEVALRRLLGGILQDAGVTTPVSVRCDGERETPEGVEVVRWEDGRAQYLGLLPTFGLPKESPRPMPPQRECTVRFPSPTPTYDVRERRFLGNVDSCTATLLPGHAVILARLPYQVSAVLLDVRVTTTDWSRPPPGGHPPWRTKRRRLAEGDTVPRGSTITVRIAIDGIDGEPVRHAVHVDVRKPDGEPLAIMARNLFTVDGRTELTMPVAHNEQPGTWTIAATDVASGCTSIFNYRVGP